MRRMTPQDLDHAANQVAEMLFGGGWGRATDEQMGLAVRVVLAVERRIERLNGVGLQDNPEAPDAP